MKRALALVVAILLCRMPAALAVEEIIVVVDYEGAWIPIEDHNFKLYLPIDWYTYALEPNELFAAGEEDASRFLSIERYANKGYTLESVAEELNATAGFQGVTPRVLNGVKCVLYESPANNMFGAIVLSEKSDTMFFFKFSPYGDEAFGYLAKQIMSSLTFSE